MTHNISPSIVVENELFWLINKPINWTVQRDDDAPSILQWLHQQTAIKPLPIHRLDKPTSGLLLVAKTDAANRELSQAFADRRVKKTYLAVSDKKPKKKQGWIKGDMAPSRRGQWKLLRSLDNPAMTQFYSYSLDAPYRGFVLTPKTGKTHQLRVALKSLGAPILGDERYAGTQASRLFLHAWQLEFECFGQHFHFQQDPINNAQDQWPFALPNMV